jgi:multidrug resistance efflux pump
MSLNTAYHDKMEAQLKEISAKIDKYKAKAAKVSADAKIEIEKEIAKLRPMQETARTKLAELKAASSEKWEELKVGIDKAWTDITAAVERIGRRTSDDGSKGKV